MTNQEGRERLSTNVPPEVKEIVEEQDDYQWKVITDAIMQTYGGERLNSIPALEREREQHSRQIRNFKEEISDREEEIDRRKRRIGEIDGRIEQMEEERSTYADEIEALLNKMAESSMHVYIGHSRIQRLARHEYGGKKDEKQKQVIADLKDRADERDLGLSASRFEEYSTNGGGW